MKLYDAPFKSRIRVGDMEFNFSHLDGMYSYCTDDQGVVWHIAAWEEVEVIGEANHEPS